MILVPEQSFGRVAPFSLRSKNCLLGVSAKDVQFLHYVFTSKVQGVYYDGTLVNSWCIDAFVMAGRRTSYLLQSLSSCTLAVPHPGEYKTKWVPHTPSDALDFPRLWLMCI